MYLNREKKNLRFYLFIYFTFSAQTMKLTNCVSTHYINTCTIIFTKNNSLDKLSFYSGNSPLHPLEEELDKFKFLWNNFVWCQSRMNFLHRVFVSEFWLLYHLHIIISFTLVKESIMIKFAFTTYVRFFVHDF